MADNNLLLASLHANDLAMLRPHLRDVNMHYGEVAARVGEKVQAAYFPHGGILSYVVEMKDGDFVETAMIGREDHGGWPRSGRSDEPQQGGGPSPWACLGDRPCPSSRRREKERPIALPPREARALDTCSGAAVGGLQCHPRRLREDVPVARPNE